MSSIKMKEKSSKQTDLLIIIVIIYSLGRFGSGTTVFHLLNNDIQFSCFIF